mmetsp:Transcript_34848/g.74283  ORF Transcript_34848/g.74283 Transcript_34848/m.74283 type:complete len:468 (-) Transcript_34848:81-1484(-)
MAVQVLVLHCPPVPNSPFLDLLVHYFRVHPLQQPELLFADSEVLRGEHSLLGKYLLVVLLGEQRAYITVRLHLGHVGYVPCPRVDFTKDRGLAKLHLDDNRGGLAMDAEAVPPRTFGEDRVLVRLPGDKAEFLAEASAVRRLILRFVFLIPFHQAPAVGMFLDVSDDLSPLRSHPLRLRLSLFSLWFVDALLRLQLHEVVVHLRLAFQLLPKPLVSHEEVIVVNLPLTLAVLVPLSLWHAPSPRRRRPLPPPHTIVIRRQGPVVMVTLLGVLRMLVLQIVMGVELLPLPLPHGEVVVEVLLLLFEVHHLSHPNGLHVHHLVAVLSVHEHLRPLLFVPIEVTLQVPPSAFLRVEVHGGRHRPLENNGGSQLLTREEEDGGREVLAGSGDALVEALLRPEGNGVRDGDVIFNDGDGGGRRQEKEREQREERSGERRLRGAAAPYFGGETLHRCHHHVRCEDGAEGGRWL